MTASVNHRQRGAVPKRRVGFEIIAVAASAGGLNAISQVLAALPEAFPCAVAIVQHLDPRHRSQLADILSCLTPLLVK